ncbi:hypothetical protein FJY63_03600, partial [Candidatus Sumerlaeota bacterium]|nr:hypothetical protein [Candidatus Sumerlaeota bacterium]
GVVVDRLDNVNELDETNNYAFLDGYSINQSAGVQQPPMNADERGLQIGGDSTIHNSPFTVHSSSLPDLVVTAADFQRYPIEMAPGTPLFLSARIDNQGSSAARPFWVEFWGSRNGGLTLDDLLVESVFVPGLDPGEATMIAFGRALYSIPDGPYTFVVVADRVGKVAEAMENNNRRPVARKRLLVIRPQTQANLVREDVSVAPQTLVRGKAINLSGQIRNAGTENSGPFWIEVFGSFRSDFPQPDFFICDSILVQNLAAGKSVDLSQYPRTLYANVPTGQVSIIVFADRTDLVNETNEADNYVILSGYQISQ